MRLTNITILRPNLTSGGPATTLATHLPVQIDQSSMREMIEARQVTEFRAVDLWTITTLYKPAVPIHRGDRLTDELTTDPETGVAYVYKVVSRPKDFDDHQELLAETVIGQ